MSLSSVLLVVLGASLASAVLGAASVLALLWAWPRIERFFFARFAAYQADIDKTKSTLPFETERKLNDAELAEYAAVREELRRNKRQLERAEQVLDEQIARREHVLAGGEIDDSPTRWRKGEVSK